jgi:hypothetical protein
MLFEVKCLNFQYCVLLVLIRSLSTNFLVNATLSTKTCVLENWRSSYIENWWARRPVLHTRSHGRGMRGHISFIEELMPQDPTLKREPNKCLLLVAWVQNASGNDVDSVSYYS